MMCYKQHLTVTLLLFACSAVFAQAVTSFETLLEESNMVFTLPAGFSETERGSPGRFQAGKRIKSDDGQVQIDYLIRPLGRIRVDYEDPHNSAPHPNDLFDMLFRSIVGSLAQNGVFDSKAYPVDQAQQLFNAGWASVAIFDLQPSVSTRYNQALLVAIHRNDLADAYTLLMTNDLEKNKSTIFSAITSLQFAQPQEPLPFNPHLTTE